MNARTELVSTSRSLPYLAMSVAKTDACWPKVDCAR